jgi:hypothetical protein
VVKRAALVLVLGGATSLAASCSLDDLPTTSTTGDADIWTEGGDAVSEDVVTETADSCDGVAPKACYEGPAGTLDVGACQAGLSSCDADGGFGPCVGQVLPATADCQLDAFDTDCDDLTGAHVWSKRFGDSSLQRLQHLTVDGSGNVFATGYSTGAIPLGPGLTLAPGLYLFKLDASGGVAWGKSWETNIGLGVSALPNGDVVLAGLIGGTIDFGGGPLVPQSAPAPILARFDANGEHGWSRLIPAQIEAVRAKSATELIAAGMFWGTLDWSGAPPIQAEGSTDLVIASLNPEDGDANWVRGYGGDVTVNRLALDSQNGIVLVGRILAFADLGGGTLGNGNVVTYVAKFDASGNHLWSKTFGPIGMYYGTPGVAVAPDDSIWVAVPFEGSFQLDGKTHVSKGDHDLFVVRFDPDGKILAERRLGDAGNQLSWDLQVDLDGNAVIGGGFEGSIDAGDCAVTQTVGIYDAFLIKLDPQADPMWLHLFGDADDSGWEGLPDEVFFALAPGPGGSITAGGQFDGTVDFGGGGLVAGTGNPVNDIVIARYAP